jgi:prepilin-type N-terminal cleavage/methylation domain-containing protein
MKSRLNRLGLTLVELMVSMTIGSIVVLLVVVLTVNFYGDIYREQVRSEMVIESQLFLRKLVDDIRVSNAVRPTNLLTDSYAPVGGWVTSDPSNILIVTSPAVDVNRDFIYDSDTGYPYQNEIIYFGSGSNMYRRVLNDSAAAGNVALTTCPSGTSGCPADVLLSRNLQNLTFIFYDQDDAQTSDASLARSVSLTVNLTKQVFGKSVTISNTTRTTLRNED